MPTTPEAAAGGPSQLAEGLLAGFSEFVEELRAAGVPVSTTEVIDATAALRALPLEDREALKMGLAATLVKEQGHWQAFEALFDLYFSLPLADEATAMADLGISGATAVDELTASQLSELAYRALAKGDRDLLALLARAAVSRFAGMEPGRSAGGSYYVFKTLRQLGTDDIIASLLASAQLQGGLAGRLAEQDYLHRLELLHDEVEGEVHRCLVAERGAQAVARSLRRPLPEDVDFMHLNKDELAALQRAVQPLARKLAVHLARKRRRRSGGRLDFRATMRRSLSSGGVPIEPRFKSPQRSKPELWALADVSGSVAAFARFTLQLVYALSSQFSRTRAWVFIDGVDEVTDLVKGADDVADAVHHINSQADVIWLEGHSDYGHAFVDFLERWGRELTPRTTVLVLGDARNNYHPVQAWAVAELASRARHVWWLNPEPQAYWDTGDSVLAQYGAHCTGVVECRNLRQLRHFVETLP
ncbi:MAG: vWA domain-containing protein [Acidimicrobiales bacterium]